MTPNGRNDTNGTLLSISDITPELLNKVAQRFIEEDVDHIEPTWWKVLSDVSMIAVREGNPYNPDMMSPHAAMIMSALEQVRVHGVEPRVIGGIMLKAIIAGWRMAEMHLTEGTKGVVQ